MINKFKFFGFLLSLLLMSSCTNYLYYGYLPGGDYQFYEPLIKRNLNGLKIHLNVVDGRNDIKSISCSGYVLDRTTELEGDLGFQFFKYYCRAMLEYNGAVYDENSQDTLSITLRGLSAIYSGFGYIKIYGLIEFEANGFGINTKKYCSEMVDGDDDAPLKWYSITTRKDALRKIVSGSTRRALEDMVYDLEKSNNIQTPEKSK